MSENELTPTEHDVQYVVTTSDGQPEQAPGIHAMPSLQA